MTELWCNNSPCLCNSCRWAGTHCIEYPKDVCQNCKNTADGIPTKCRFSCDAYEYSKTRYDENRRYSGGAKNV